MLFGCAVPSDSKETKLGRSHQESSPSAGNNTGVVLVPISAWKCIPTAISVVWIFPRSLGVICYNRWVLSEGHKNYLKDCCLINSQSTFLFLIYFWLSAMAISSKRCKPDNFESYNSLNLILPMFEVFVQICWLWIFHWLKLFRHSCSMWDKIE